MLVREIMTSNTETVDSNASLVEVAEKMNRLSIGALPVWQGDELVGMITDRDITVRGVAQRKDISNTQVSEIMTPEVFYCLENDEIEQAARIMEEKSIHRLLVLNQEYEPTGFISLGDIAVKSRNEHLSWEILEKISEPACPHRRD